MINVIASVRVKAGKLPEFLPMVKDNVPKVREERGCIEYFPAVDIDAELPPVGDAGLPQQQFDEDAVT